MKLSLPFGIDLGTTRTAAAIFAPDASRPVVATDESRKATIPSVLRAVEQGRWRVGHDALDSGEGEPLLRSVKRFMGETEPLRQGGDLMPEEASAIIVSAIADRMGEHLRKEYPDYEILCGDAVITVPAYFDAPQIEATRRAGRLAGLSVAALVQEPTAAAIYHTWKHDLGDGTFLIYDLGGGTFDVSIIRSLYGEYQVLAIDGDNHLGGDDFDRRLADHLFQQLRRSGYELGEGLDTDEDRRQFDVLIEIARRAKEELSETAAVTIDESALFDDRGGNPVSLHTELSRDAFEELIEDLLEATVLACENALISAQKRHNLAPSQVDGIFLVGASTRVPAVRRRLLQALGDELDVGDEDLWSDEPETSVALGASLYAAAICDLRFRCDDGGITIGITDLPTRPGADHLIGHVHWPGGPDLDNIDFGGRDEGLRIPLEARDELRRFSAPNFDSWKLDPEGSPLVSTTLSGGGEIHFGPDELWFPTRPEGARRAPTLALTNPAVLAKDINVEILEDGGPVHHRLIERGTHLPTTARHHLLTGDRSGALVLRLFQHRLPIHTLVMTLPDDTPPGESIELEVDVDQAMNISASGSVGDQSFAVRIDRPTTPKRWQWEQIEVLLDQTDDVARRLWGSEARRFEARSRNLRAGINAAVRHDPHRLQVLARRLEGLLKEYAPRSERTPGRERIDAMLDTIRRLVFAADEQRLGRSHREWRHRLDELADAVDQAWRADEDQRWRDVADRVQATYESIGQDEFFFRRRDPETYGRALLDTLRSRIQTLRSRADNFPLEPNREARKLQRDELKRIVEELERQRSNLPAMPPDAEDVAFLERSARSLDHLDRRLERLRTLGVPRRGDSS